MISTPFSDSRLEAVIDRAWAQSRLSMRTRIDRVRAKSWLLGQCAIAAGVAWFVATRVFQHPTPFFAPIVAVVCLGMSYGQRLRRVVEVTVGVAVGVAVADTFVAIVGSGAWQITAVVLVSMSIALLLDAGQLLVTQSAVQSIFIAAFQATPGQAFTRWTDALIGGGVALAAATIVPAAPLRRPRAQGAQVLRTIEDLLRDAARSASDGDVARAARVLAAARATDGVMRELQDAALEGLSAVRVAPMMRAEALSVRRMAGLVEPLDRVLRSTRVLVRRVSIAAHRGAVIPASHVELLNDLADAVDVLARAMADGAEPAFGRGRLIELSRRTSEVEREPYYVTILLAQMRSLCVDLLQVTGLDYEAAVAAVPPLPIEPQS